MHESRRQDLRILGIEGQSVVYNTSPGPHVGAPLSVRAPLGHIKGRARPLEHRSRRTQALANSPSHSRGKAIQHRVDVGYYAPAARTTLNLAVFIVFLG